MDEPITSREQAWLRSIEAPPAPRGGRRSAAHDTRVCLEAAHSALAHARQVLDATSPVRSRWKRYALD
jgi:hypothetical protein